MLGNSHKKDIANSFVSKQDSSEFLSESRSEPTSILVESTRSFTFEITSNQGSPAEICLQYSDINEDKKREVLKAFQNLVDSLEINEANPYKAGQAIKRALKKFGWKYNDNIFKLDEILSAKSGNCFGLTLLIGAILESKGIHSNYAILANPTDAISKEDTKMLYELEHGAYFKRENPQLFSLRKWNDELEDIDRPNRFGFAEHPVIIHDGNILETTNFNTDDYEGWQPEKYDTYRALTFKQLASVLIVEDLKRDPQSFDKLSQAKNRADILKALQESIKIWPENYEAYHYLCMIAQDTDDKTLEKEAFSKFEQLEANNGRYYFMKYILTGNTEDLCKSYALCPTASNVYLEYTKKMVKSAEERKFDLAVVSYLVAFSSEKNLEQFYNDEQEFIESIYGEDYYRDLMDSEI